MWSLIIFLFTLHPVSGWPGGLIYLLVGWALPSFFLTTLCVGVASLFSKKRIVQFIIFLCALIFLGINTDLPSIVEFISYKEITKMEIRSVAQLSKQKYSYIDVKYESWPRIYTKPFGSRVQVGGDEGCGCFYFVDPEGTIYSDRFIQALKAINNKDALVMNENTFADYKNRDVHLEVSFYPYKSADKLLMLAEIYENGDKTAEFIHEGIPISIDIERNGVGREKLQANFFENAFDILLHNNFISSLMNLVVPSYFPQKAIDTFLKRAISP